MRQLRGQVDDALRAQVAAVQNGDAPARPAAPWNPAERRRTGAIRPVRRRRPAARTTASGDISLPVRPRAVSIATSGNGTYMGDVHVGANHLRELIFPALLVSPNGDETMVAVQLARPLNQVDHVLSELRLILVLLGARRDRARGGARADRGAARARAAGRGRSYRRADRRDRRPLARLKIHADDEVGQLATRFNAMLDRLEASRAALDESVRAQRQLVADASHELRTPVTSLRTNIEVLLAGRRAR